MAGSACAPVPSGELDDVIQTMLTTDRITIVDVCVDQRENCFPMIPSGAAHNEMLLGPDDEQSEHNKRKGKVLV